MSAFVDKSSQPICAAAHRTVFAMGSNVALGRTAPRISNTNSDWITEALPYYFVNLGITDRQTHPVTYYWGGSRGPFPRIPFGAILRRVKAVKVSSELQHVQKKSYCFRVWNNSNFVTSLFSPGTGMCYQKDKYPQNRPPFSSRLSSTMPMPCNQSELEGFRVVSFDPQPFNLI